jgi:hypothetical protein
MPIQSFECMCNELSKKRAGGTAFSGKQELPMLPQGCLKRLLRRVEFPVTISSHKPSHVDLQQECKTAETFSHEREYPNADYAVIFGTTVGTDLASQMPIPAIEQSDIRRYACLSVALDRKQEYDSFQEDPIPATFESYAMVPPTKPRPFGDVSDEMRLR